MIWSILVPSPFLDVVPNSTTQRWVCLILKNTMWHGSHINNHIEPLQLQFIFLSITMNEDEYDI